MVTQPVQQAPVVPLVVSLGLRAPELGGQTGKTKFSLHYKMSRPVALYVQIVWRFVAIFYVRPVQEMIY